LETISIRYTDRLSGAEIKPSVESVGDCYDNVLAESANGLFATEVIRHRGPGRNLETAEFAALECLDSFNHRRLLIPIGNPPPAKNEAACYRQPRQSGEGRDSNPPVSGKAGAG